MKRILFVAALAVGLASAAGAASKPLFESDAPLKVGLRGPFSQLSAAPPGSSLVVDGSLTVDGQTLPVKLSPRGITRRAKDICTFAPVKLTFPDKPGEGSPFKGQKSLKLVSHCRTGESFQQYILLEYTAYRIYELLTPASLHTRLAQVDYADAAGKPMISRISYFIEAIDDAAKRNGTKEFKAGVRVPTADISPAGAARFAAFAYMIGNLDYAMNAGPPGSECCHNAKLIGTPGALIPIPYDFDFSGLVDAPYATPPAAIPLPNVRVRRYHGFCRHNAEAVTAIADIAGKRAAIIGVLDTVPGLEPKTKAKATAYLNGFFEQAADPAQVQKLLKGCSG